jgi:plastocyanin
MHPLIRTACAVALVTATCLAGAPSTLARDDMVYTIGVDNTGPSRHDYQYVDYFPRSDVNVHRGDVLDFRWNTGSLDGLHTVTFVPSGVAPPDFATLDADDGFTSGPPELNPALLNPSNTGCGGSITNSCNYTGAQVLNSGAKFDPNGGDFFVQLNVAPGQLTWICLIHPGMTGSVNVVPDSVPASSITDVQAAAESQLDSDTVGARIAEAQARSRSVTTNPGGTHTVTMTAGTATQYVEVLEMLPVKVDVRPGDILRWVTDTKKEPHTVTFPQGPGSDPVDPLPTMCEAAPADTLAPLQFPLAVAPFGCTSAGEVHIVPQPLGGTVISTPKTVASSGIISTLPGFPSSYSFSFPDSGTFEYQCRIHDHMRGVVTVNRHANNE